MDDKELTKAGEVIGNPLAKIEAQKSAGLSEFHRQCAEAELFGSAEMKRLQEINAALVAPFVAFVEELNIKDRECAQNLFELRSAMAKPSELREHLRALKSTRWEDISSPSYHDVIDQRKFDNLVRHYRNTLTRVGNIEGHVNSLISRTRERIITLAESSLRNGAVPKGAPLNIPSREDVAPDD